MKFQVKENSMFTLVEFSLDGPITPSTLGEVQPPKVDARKGVVISGRGPVWLYCFLAHFYHFCAWVATMDPRLGGGVVVQTHSPAFKEGDVVPVE